MQTRASHFVALAAAAALALPACGSKQRPADEPRVDPATRSWIEQADEQERMRRHSRARLLYLRAKREAPDDVSRAYAAGRYGEMLAQWGEDEAARRELELSLSLYPEHPGNWRTLAFVRHHLGDIDGAITAFEKSIELAPNVWVTRRDYAGLLVNQKRYADAVAQYERILQLDPPEKIRAAIGQVLPELRALSKP